MMDRWILDGKKSIRRTLCWNRPAKWQFHPATSPTVEFSNNNNNRRCHHRWINHRNKISRPVISHWLAVREQSTEHRMSCGLPRHPLNCNSNNNRRVRLCRRHRAEPIPIHSALEILLPLSFRRVQVNMYTVVKMLWFSLSLVSNWFASFAHENTKLK